MKKLKYVYLAISAVILVNLSCGVYAGSDAQATAIALGKTQGAPVAATNAVKTYIAAQEQALGYTPTPTHSGGLLNLLPNIAGNPLSTPAPGITPTPMHQIGTVTTKAGENGRILWHWFQNQPGIVGYSEFFPGQTTGVKGIGQIRSGFQLPVYETASVNHYFAVRITGWLELTDIDLTKNVTLCIVHDWGDHAGENKQQCHAHLFPGPDQKNVDSIEGVIMPNINLRVLQFNEEYQMYQIELIQPVWFNSDQVDFSQ